MKEYNIYEEQLDATYSIVDSKTGERLVVQAETKEEAVRKFLGEYYDNYEWMYEAVEVGEEFDLDPWATQEKLDEMYPSRPIEV